MGIQINGATDSITAIDGTIDVVSAIGNAGVVTATAFVGNITGNVTGNINHASALELQTGGVTRGKFDSSGRMLLNTTTEGHSNADDLTIATTDHTGITLRSATNRNGSVFFSDGTSGGDEYRGWIQYTHTSDYLTFGTNATEKFRIDSDGRVKIGTTSNTPASANEPGIVFGDNTAGTATKGIASFCANGAAPLLLTRRVSDGNVLGIADDTTTRGMIRVNSNDLEITAVEELRLSTGAGHSEKIRLTNAGRFGIGVGGPDAMLHVKGSDNVLGLFESTDADSLIQFKDNGTSDTILMGALGGDDLLLRCDAGNIVFHVANNNERVRITSNGRLNIGTGNLNQTDRMLNVYGGRMRIEGISSGNSFEIMNSANAGSSFGMLIQAGANSSDINSTFRNTSGSTLFRIRGDGYVAIGHDSPATRLDVKQNNGVAYNGRAQSVAYGVARFLNESGHTSGGTYTGFQFNITGDSQNRICAIGMITEASNTRKSSLVFATDDGTNRTEKLKILSNGHLITQGNNTGNPIGMELRNNNTSAYSHAELVLTSQNATSSKVWCDVPNAGMRLQYNGGTTVKVNQSGNLVMASGSGIDFSATGNTSSGSSHNELLDDYEEGQWSPGVKFGGTTATVTSNGKYTKIGNLVHITYQVSINNLNSGTGTIRCTNLPFTPSQSPSYSHGNVQGNSNKNLPSNAGSTMPYVETNQTEFRILYDTPTAHGDVNETMFDVSTTFYGDATYFTTYI